LSHINKHIGFNVGGLNPVYYAFTEDCDSVTFNKKTFEGIATLKAGKAWNYLYSTDESVQIEADEEITNAGTKYSYKIKQLVPKDRSEVEIQLNKLNGRGLIVKCTDKNGVTRLYGLIGNPMRKLSKRLLPGAMEGFNGWEVTLFGTFSHPAGYVAPTGAVPFPPSGT